MIWIRNGRVMDPTTGFDSVLDLTIENGQIAAMGVVTEPDQRWDSVIDAAGLVVAPGLVDVHAHFRDPGFTYKEDMLTGSRSAARGGYTSVVCMANTKPVVDRPETLKLVLARARQSPIRLYSVAAVSRNLKGTELTDMARLKATGAVGFSDDGLPLLDEEVLRRAMKQAKAFDVPISLHEEDSSRIGVAGINEGEVSKALGLRGAPAESESDMVRRDCALALETGARVHMQHLSCAASVQAVREYKARGARITAEVTPQHISLTERAVLDRGSLAKLNPPLRTEADRLALVEGLRDGAIDCIATDHAPHSDEEKARPLREAPSGMTGLETALALGITNLVNTGALSLMELLQKMTIAPARVYGLDAGLITVGGTADLVLFDPGEVWTVKEFASKARNSPFVGTTLTGRVRYTLCRGKVIHRPGD